jgi:hypothetical protein
MHSAHYTKHFNKRSQQRGLNHTVVEVLLGYGECCRSHHGVDSIMFTRNSLSEIRNDYGAQVFRMCEKFKNAYIIMTGDGVLITVARRFRKTIH